MFIQFTPKKKPWPSGPVTRTNSLAQAYFDWPRSPDSGQQSSYRPRRDCERIQWEGEKEDRGCGWFTGSWGLGHIMGGGGGQRSTTKSTHGESPVHAGWIGQQLWRGSRVLIQRRSSLINVGCPISRLIIECPNYWSGLSEEGSGGGWVGGGFKSWRSGAGRGEWWHHWAPPHHHTTTVKWWRPSRRVTRPKRGGDGQHYDTGLFVV